MPTIAVINQKGGVGKTTTVLGLASAARQADLSCLVVDLDPQGNASLVLGAHEAGQVEEHLTTRDVLLSGLSGAAADAVLDTAWTGVRCIPADRNVALVEREPVAADALRTTLKGVADLYDVVLLDCPPSLGVLVTVALTAADRAVLVSSPSAFAVSGCLEAIETVRQVQAHFNPDLALAGILVNAVRATREAQIRLSELRAGVGADLIEPVIPMRALIEEASGAGAPISSYTDVEGQRLAGLYSAHLLRLLKPRRSH